ncbi:Bcmtq1 [Botrytis cinerea B05.10]|uniref:Bcmtq1 n=1 Tax=Botryotinia fuckeliana (strain B05.10) TaxID=332648 RepID=A0A384JBW2_BOTFB|nr:Bcmtq1 [Botrytis cinerea B05.10]ATZ48076.1 Bcmtq1 [Botrytis cinerea B05.10]
MPRLSHALLRRAYNISPLLPLVLRETRSLSSAINELRWLREHVDKTMSHRVPSQKWRTLLKLCQRRAIGEPLQYILGTQPFGELEIQCQPGVLIPRNRGIHNTSSKTSYQSKAFFSPNIGK